MTTGGGRTERDEETARICAELRQGSSAFLGPCADIGGQPHLSHGESSDRGGEGGVRGDLLDALPADAEQASDLGRAHEVHGRQTSGHLTSTLGSSHETRSSGGIAVETQSQIVRYTGINRRGTNIGGALPLRAIVHLWVKARFDAGWRELSLTRNGDTVGGIGPNLDDGKRTWWAEM